MVHHADTSPRTELHPSSVRLPSPVPLWSQHFGELSCETILQSRLIHLSRCVLVFTPLIPPVATVESTPHDDDLSNNTTLSSFPTRCWLLTYLPNHRQQRWPTVRLPKHSLHQQAPREKWPSLCRPTRTWHMLLLPRGRKPRNPEENCHP